MRNKFIKKYMSSYGLSDKCRTTLSLRELQNYKAETSVVFAEDRALLKELRLTFDGAIQVWQNGILLYETFYEEYEAIKLYNSIIYK